MMTVLSLSGGKDSAAARRAAARAERDAQRADLLAALDVVP